jgi:hypothetical protein
LDDDKLGCGLRLDKRLGNNEGHAIADMSRLIVREDRLQRAMMTVSGRRGGKRVTGEAAKPIAGYVFSRQHRNDAAGGSGRARVDRGDLRVRVW